MAKLAVVLLILAMALQPFATPFTVLPHNMRWLLIDCGVKSRFSESFNGQTWFTDGMLIDTGKVRQIDAGNNISGVMTTLRYFSKGGKKHCYTLPLDNSQRYIFRAGFYNGNYDGIFDLLLGGQLWATVNSSVMAHPVFHELMYRPKNDNIQVCLMGRKDGGNPFISSIEATSLNEFSDYERDPDRYMYGLMENGTAYHLVSRLNFGSIDQVIPPWSGLDQACGEWVNRYWIPRPMPGYANVTFEANICIGDMYDNRVPDSVLNTAISPVNPSHPIYVSISLPDDNPQSAYIVLYFHQTLNKSATQNFTRIMDIYIDGFVRGTVKLNESESGEVLSLNHVSVKGVVNITIAPGEGTVLPPLLNGMEVFISSKLSDELTSGGSLKVPYSFMVAMISVLLCYVFTFSSY